MSWIRRPKRAWLCTLCAILALTGVALARQATVTTHDGRTFRGEVESESEKGIKLNIAGISTLIPREEVKDVKIELTVAEEYRKRRGEISDDDLDARYKLASWLYDRKGYELARRELRDLAERFPDDGRVASLLNLVEAKIKLLREREAQQAATPPGPSAEQQQMPDGSTQQQTDGETAAAPQQGADQTQGEGEAQEIPLLTEEQINLIKVYEIDLDRRQAPRIIIPRDALMEFMDAYSDQDSRLRGTNSRRRFLTMSGAEQLAIMFELKARDFYGRVEVRDDPTAMLNFKRFVYRQVVVNHCGTTRCHGGTEGGAFRLVPARRSDDPTVYTNFYLLNSWQRGMGYMIDRSRPQESYLVQYAMPREAARFPHPDVPGYQPHFRTRDDRVYGYTINWIEQLYSPAPEYGIDYDLPWGEPPREPAGGQTGTAGESQ